MKNKLLFLVALITFSINVNAQSNLYPVEDPWFLSYLQANYPQTIVNDSLDIDATGGIDTLDLPFMSYFTNIDPVQFFNDLTYLSCWGQDITSLPELPDGLKVLRCASNELTSLPELPNGLIWLSCGGNQLTSLPELPDALGILLCNQNNLTSLPLLPQNLSTITFFENPIECVSNHLPQFPELNTYPICYGCTDPLYLEYEALAADDDGSCATIISVGCMDLNADNYNESANVSGACDYSCPLTPNGTSYLDGICYENVWTYGYTVEVLEGIGYECSCVVEPIYGCMDSVACNYNTIATLDDGFCTYPETYYNCNGSCIEDSDEDGVCDVLEVSGCTDDYACNYYINATDDDGSCTYPETYYNCYDGCINDTDSDGVCDELEILGCTDTIACDYDSTATDDGFCTYLEMYYDCNGVCIYDTDVDGVCDELEISGCTDPIACNYDPSATNDNVSCTYPEAYYDCNGCINDIDLDGECDEFDYDDGLDLDDVSIEESKLIRIIDVLGREVKEQRKGVLLFYIYDNGKVVKRLIH